MSAKHESILTLIERYVENLKIYEDFLLKQDMKKEKETTEKFINFFKTTKEPFSRQSLKGHFCGSAWVLDKTLQKVVLTHHKKLDLWIQLGGHADGEENLYHVALKEALEESGLKQIRSFKSDQIPFDLSVHEIPEHKNVPAHHHYDVTFVFVAEDGELVCSEESRDLAWFSFEEAYKICDPASVYQLKKLEFFLSL